MITEADCVLPLDEERRERIVQALCEAKLDTVADCGGIRDVVMNGYKGLLQYTDEELVEEAEYVLLDWET